MRFPLGVVHVVFGAVPIPDAASRARALGFDHIDVPWDWSGDLALPVGDRMAYPSPHPHCSVPAPPASDGMWERAVAAYRRVPGVRMEPWPGSICGSNEAVLRMIEEVPGLRLLVDTGHVASWGGDPVALLPWADHVQLRQATPDVPQALEGDVDIPAVLARLEHLDYRGLLSVEYFDLPEQGWPLAEPEAYALALAEQVRALL